MSELVFAVSTVLLAFITGVLLVWFLMAMSYFRGGRRQYHGRPAGATVVIPAYNEEGTIGECIDAVLGSDYPKKLLEVILVDDGSTDDTVRIARTKGVKVISQNHLGKVEALNKGVFSAKNGIVVTIDADTMVERQAIRELVKPFSDKRIGSVSGIAKVQNGSGLLSSFQRVEYVYNFFIREVSSSLFRSSLGICGALSAYRTSLLRQLGGFKKTTASEDFDIALHIRKMGYGVITADRARGYTIVPDTMQALTKQRIRWGRGVFQSLVKHRDILFTGRASFAMSYLLAIQLFWYVYAIFAFPMFTYQVFYWLPYNTGSAFDLFFYLLRWVSIAGPLWMVWMIPQWGISAVTIFGVTAGLLTVALMLLSIRHYNERLDWKAALAIVFFFPYTLDLTAMFLGSMVTYARHRGQGVFLK
ncbi:MAG: glycosyltransferase [Candidatus Aenigmarchaeota archaeon]|nr:glycosyltransferase [Candidatus Aenigmarchaeota archaeon]